MPSSPKAISILGGSTHLGSVTYSAPPPFGAVSIGRPWRPCLTMRRLIAHFWTADRTSYIGRSLTIYRDPSAIYGGLQVGGIRVSHVDGIDKPETVVLQENNKKKKTYTIQPLKKQAKAASETPRQDTKPTPDADPYAEYARTFAKKLKEEPWQAVDSWWTDTEAQREGMAPERVERMNAALAAKIEKETA